MKRWIEWRAALRRLGETLSNFTPFLKPRRGGLLLALVILLAETGTSLAQPWPLALALDYVLNDNKRLPGFWPGSLSGEALLLAGIAFLLVFITMASRGLSSFRRYLLQKLGQETVFDMREALYEKVHDLGLDYHGKKRTGDTITRVTSDVKEVRSLLVDSIVEVGSSFFILIGMLVIMMWMSWQLTLLSLVTVPFLFFAVKRYRSALVERMRVVRTKEGAIASVSQLTVFVFYLGLFLSPLWALSRQANQIGKSLVSGERIIELLGAEPSVKESPDARPAPVFEGRVTFEDVHFTYTYEAGEVLNGMDFDVEAGTRVALVGLSGSGKTTVTSLIARLYDPQSGRVLIDEEDIRE